LTTSEAQIATVVELLPNAMFRVRLEDKRELRAGLAPQARHAIVRLIVGNQVLVQIAQHDPGRAQIVAKLK
jgi:translation initiation factor IF-1